MTGLAGVTDSTLDECNAPSDQMRTGIAAGVAPPTLRQHFQHTQIGPAASSPPHRRLAGAASPRTGGSESPRQLRQERPSRHAVPAGKSLPRSMPMQQVSPSTRRQSPSAPRSGLHGQTAHQSSHGAKLHLHQSPQSAGGSVHHGRR